MARHPQSDPSAVELSEILSSQDPPLGSVLKRAQLLLQLQQRLADSLDPALAGRFQVANIRENRLILLTPAAAWATRLRMQAPQLLQKLHRAGFTELRQIEVRVAPLVTQPEPSRAARPLSATARQFLGLLSRFGAGDKE